MTTWLYRLAVQLAARALTDLWAGIDDLRGQHQAEQLLVGERVVLTCDTDIADEDDSPPVGFCLPPNTTD